ncbi:hypothetical protein DXC28_11780 [Ruminococcus sp. OM08-9BH]|nr:hypothetical protein DXC28_11780 [Ruminococcus sp. OM08-9BH]
MKKIKQFLVMLLVISLSITSLGSTVFAAGDFSSETQDEQITDSSQNLNVEGTDSVGDMLASVISEENNNSEERKQSANNITGLEIEDDTAVVEFQTQTDAEVVVAVYDEQRVQMLASGNEMVSQDENMATVTISGDMPQYFAATAYLLDTDSHEPLCEAYNTELYTKDVQDLKNSTADDYDSDKVLQLDEDDKKTNFAVFNEETTVADEGADKNQLNDNGDGTYTITNADSSFTDLKVGDTFSYNYEDGTVLLVKVADISVKGTTVTVRKDTDTDLTDYFDYVKIETDEVQEDWNVDNSDLEEGVTAADSEAYTQASRIGGSGSSKYSTSWNIYKNLDENVTITGSFKYSFSFTIDVYITAGYQYLSVKDEYSAGIEVDITGKSKLIDIPLGRISTQPIICVKVELIPAFLVETSGSVTWSGEIKGSSGGAYDSNSGFKNLSSSPSCQSSLKVEGKIFMGVKVSPSVSIVDSDLANASLGFSGGAEIAASYSVYDTSKDQIHECKKCLKGEVKSKLSMELTVKLIKGKVYRKRSYDLGTVKTGDFYYSIDYDEFGWTTCPHVCYPVKISVTDKDGKAIKGTSTVRVADSKTGEVVEIRDKTSSMESVELTDSKETKVYLPNGSYIVRAVKDKLEGEAKLTVHDRGTQVVVKLKSESGAGDDKDNEGDKNDKPSAVIDSGEDGNITWRLTEDGTLYISGQGDMLDYGDSDENEPEAPWKYKTIKKVNIERGVTSIGNRAFEGCSSLKSIEIPDGVTSIGSCTFVECSNLESIKIPAGVRGIGSSTFIRCSSLQTIEIPNTVTSIGQCTFEECSSLESIKIPAEVSWIGEWAFYKCSSLQTIEIPDNVTSISQSTFEDCSSLESIEIPDGVTSIEEHAFAGCSSLKNIKIPDGVTSIEEHAFEDCSSLESIEIPDGVTSIEDNVFGGCSSLESIKIPDGVTNIGWFAFSGCSSLESIKIPEGVASIAWGMFNVCSNLKSIKIPDGVTNIGHQAFRGCSSLKRIEVPDKVIWIGAEVFSECMADIYFKGNRPEMDKDCLLECSNVTIYYPQNNTTWKGIESESFGGTDIKWVPYDPTSLTAESVEAEPESLSSELQTEAEEFTDDVNAPEPDDIGDELFIEKDEAVPSPEPSEIPAQDEMVIEEGDTSTEESTEENSATGNEEITNEMPPMVSNTQEEQTSGSSMMFTDLIPYSNYLFVMVKDEDDENLLDASNLLYISQKAADETGSVSFRYMLRESYESPVPKVFGEQLKDIANTKITLSKTSYAYDGKAKTPVVTVMDDDYLLQENEDYTITYSDNIKVGTATVMITGIGRYTGTVSASFTIQQVKKNNVIKVSNITKTVSAKVQKAKIQATVNDKAKLTYSSNNKSVKVNSSGEITIAKNFTGTAVITITAAETARYKKTSCQITVTVRPTGTSLSGVTNTGSGKANVAWVRNKSVTGYRIQYSTDSKFKKNATTVNISKNQTTKTTLSKLKEGNTYYVRIATYKNAGSKIYSSWSKAKKVTIRPTGTSLSGVTNAGNGKVKVTWLRNKSATGYRIQYSTDSKFKKNVTTVNISKNQTTKVTLSKLKKGKTYYVRIATYKNVRNKVYSSWSKVKKITIKK